MRLIVCLFPLLTSILMHAQVSKLEQPNTDHSVADATTLDTRSDSIDILHTNINLDFSLLPTTTLRGTCLINFSALVGNIDHITLDLLALTVDSVKQGDEHITFTHIGES